MRSAPAKTTIVLIGGGHAHVQVLKSFGMRPEPGVRLTLIASELEAPYSGMLPGLVAGHYTHEDCHIDLARLTRFADARLIHAAATGIDRRNKHVLFLERPPLAYDLLSIDVGITPQLDEIEGAADNALVVKPISTFAPRWQSLAVSALKPNGPRRIAVNGGGAAGFELVLAMRHSLRRRADATGIDPNAFRFTLISATDILPRHNGRARALARQGLAEHDVGVIEGTPVAAVTSDGATLANGRGIAADAIVVATKAAAPCWFAGTDLPRDAEGFLAVRPTLQVLDDDNVFAVGDCATMVASPREKAGVFAVRQGPPLVDNLRRRVRGELARAFVPQRKFLTLLSIGDKRAIAARGGWAIAGPWVWRWKDAIDRRFMRKFNELPEMAARAPGAADDEEMRCGGCAAKVGPVTLTRVLDRLGSATAAGGVHDVGQREDAAVLDLGGDVLRLETIDFFRAFWPEPYLFGEIAANHAMNDIFAMGGTPDHALAVAVLPYARPRQTEDDLYQLLAGARAAFDRDGISLVGGHSSEGAELAAGFFVSGTVGKGDLLRKGGLKPGDKLILTRPLGTGILFAAWMRGKARAPAIMSAMAEMRRSNREVARILAAHGATACTDVTGFGLAGHLIEMLDASGAAARVDFGRVPTYPTAFQLGRSGIASTLLPENLARMDRIAGIESTDAASLAVLFDPQTSGGLLAGVPEDRAASSIAALQAGPATEAAIIGSVLEPNELRPGRIELRLASTPERQGGIIA
jgi:selenide,water dikinase